MLRKLFILTLLAASVMTLQGRMSLNRPHVEALEREWANMDKSRKARKNAPTELSENVRERFVEAYTLERRGRRQLAAGAYMEILDSLSSAPELYIHANVALVDFYRNKPAYENAYAEYLLRASKAMAQSDQIDPNTYIELGNYLISKGMHTQGEKALKMASVRLAQTGDHQTAAELTRLAAAESSHRQAIMWSIVAACVVVTCGAVAYAIYLSRKSRKKVDYFRSYENEFEAEREQRRQVTSAFITLALRGMEELKTFNTFVTRKLATGQSKALYADTESGTYLQGVTEKFFEEFDSAFLSSHPNFYEQVNSLLKPDRRFAPTEDGRLTPELRIAAFMMLGINDTTKLAQVLNLSVNTIYTYRNRLRSRALDRDTFEAKLAAL